MIPTRFDPHPADGFPAAFCDPLPDGFKQSWLIFLDELIDLRLALREVIIGELLHQADHVLECALGFAAGLTECPQPGNVDVRVAGCMDDHLQRHTGCLNA